jgi:Uma2 family endonuclease
MRTIVVGPRPAELEALIERRRATGADLYDEVWDGEYHMAPGPSGAHGWLDAELAVILRPLARRVGLFDTGPFNLGEPDDFRVPDRALRREMRTAMWNPTAALVVEIRSPGDESWAKLPFYAEHGVDEVVIVEPDGQHVTWLARSDKEYVEIDHSVVLEVAVVDVVAEITWPPAETE